MSKEILTTDEVIDTLRPAVDAMAVTVYGAVSNRDAAVARVLRAAIDSPDPFPALHLLLSALSGQGTGETGEAVPPTEPGSTEGVDLLLRARYIRKIHGGYFGDEQDEPLSTGLPFTAMAGLRVRVVYTYAPVAREAAEDMARRWEVRLRERGARAVEMVGEVET